MNKTKICFVLPLLSLLITSCNIFQPNRFDYYYGVTLGNVKENGLFIHVKNFYICDNFPIGGTLRGTSVSPFLKKPHPYIDLEWLIETKKRKNIALAGSSFAHYMNDEDLIHCHARVDMTLPPQFTKSRGRKISFLFYGTQVIVVYTYYPKPYDRFTEKWVECDNILADGTPYHWGDFQDFMDANPNATSDDFRNHQRAKYKPEPDK